MKLGFLTGFSEEVVKFASEGPFECLEIQNSCHLVHQNSDYLNENRIGYGPIPKVFGRRR